MKKLWAVILPVAALGSGAWMQQKATLSNDETQVMQFERAWNQAEAKQEVNAIASLMADTLAYTDYDGTFMNKTQYLRSVTKSDSKTDHLYDEGMTVRVYGNAAVAVGIYRETGVLKGKPYTRRARFTDTWIKSGTIWQCVASQSTLLPDK